jgi:hypothetical protein
MLQACLVKLQGSHLAFLMQNISVATGDLRLTREGGGSMVLRRNGVEIGSSESNLRGGTRTWRKEA